MEIKYFFITLSGECNSHWDLVLTGHNSISIVGEKNLFVLT